MAGVHLQRGELQRARELAEQHLALAQDLQDPALRMAAHTRMGDTLYYLGELIAAQAHLDQALALRTLQPDRSLTLRTGQDHMMGFTVWILWNWAIRTRP